MHIATQRLFPSWRSPFTRWFHGRLSRALGFRLDVEGKASREPGVLFVANHLSWSDVPLLGAVLDARFVAKADMETGIVGWFARLQRTMFIDRTRRRDADNQRGRMAAALAKGDRLILFPEGTTSDGTRVLSFKSALFAALTPAADAAVDMTADTGAENAAWVQPVTIVHTSIDGMPVTRRTLPLLTWMGEISLGAHAMDVLSLGKVGTKLIFHEPVRADAYPGRKALAAHLQHVIDDSYQAEMRGFISPPASSIAAPNA